MQRVKLNTTRLGLVGLLAIPLFIIAATQVNANYTGNRYLDGNAIRLATGNGGGFGAGKTGTVAKFEFKNGVTVWAHFHYYRSERWSIIPGTEGIDDEADARQKYNSQNNSSSSSGGHVGGSGDVDVAQIPITEGPPTTTPIVTCEPACTTNMQ